MAKKVIPSIKKPKEETLAGMQFMSECRRLENIIRRMSGYELDTNGNYYFSKLFNLADMIISERDKKTGQKVHNKYVGRYGFELEGEK